jgi:misacylated tRNA(Ala) deacylase
VTELAYLVDLPAAYVRSFRAHVTALPPGGVVLDRTYFYPTGGGQPSDRGTLSGDDGSRYDVTDVTKSGSAVVHRIRGSPEALRRLTVGAELAGDIDWPRRFRHMRLHTGQHLLSARIFARAGVRTRRASLAGSEATIDLEASIEPGMLEALADDLADARVHARPVSIHHVPRAEWDANPAAGRSGLVPLPPQVAVVRVVEIEGADVCPCGGTHLRSTEEIGEVRLTPLVPISGGAVRVGFSLVDGERATPRA